MRNALSEEGIHLHISTYIITSEMSRYNQVLSSQSMLLFAMQLYYPIMLPLTPPLLPCCSFQAAAKKNIVRVNNQHRCRRRCSLFQSPSDGKEFPEPDGVYVVTIHLEDACGERSRPSPEINPMAGFRRSGEVSWRQASEATCEYVS